MNPVFLKLQKFLTENRSETIILNTAHIVSILDGGDSEDPNISFISLNNGETYTVRHNVEKLANLLR